jgi:hypothetical protein
MTRTYKFSLIWCTVGITTLAVLSGCGGGSDSPDVVPPVATTVPDSAGASGAAFAAFIQGLAQGDETSEPLTFSSTFVEPAEDVTGEPVPVT